MTELAAHTVSRSALPIPLTPEDQARADLYALIARLLSAAPDAALLADLGRADALAAQQADHPLDLAWAKLVAAAAAIDAQAGQEEFDALFVSIGTPQINPYASLYLAGFMMEQPLAALRAELAEFGLARVDGGELEDHLASLCETMRILIAGYGGRRRPLAQQRAFFERHIGSWYERCLDDIRAAAGANFYVRVADFAQAFFDVES